MCSLLAAARLIVEERLTSKNLGFPRLSVCPQEKMIVV